MSDSDDDSYEPEYEWETFSIKEGSDSDLYSFDVLCVVPPPLEYMSRLHTDEQEISGRQVWTGSLMACHYLSQHPNFVSGKTVLELGSGTGVLGMFAHRLNAKSVSLTDGDEQSVDLIRQNLERNRIDPEQTSCSHMLWADEPTQSSFSLMVKAKFPFNCDARFERIIAGDVMYKRDLPSLFFQSVNEFLSDQGILLLSHIPRSCVDHEVVCLAAQNAGFTASKIDLDKTKLHENVSGLCADDSVRGCLYLISRKTS